MNQSQHIMHITKVGRYQPVRIDTDRLISMTDLSNMVIVSSDISVRIDSALTRSPAGDRGEATYNIDDDAYVPTNIYKISD